jgi:hypothetical protein
MIPVETFLGVGEGMNSSMIYLIYCKNIVNATMYPYPAQKLKRRNICL